MVRPARTDHAGAMTETPYGASPPPPPPPSSPPPPQRDLFAGLDRLRRSTTDRKIGGVCGGLARYWNVDPTILRVAAAVLVLFGGAGIILYAAAWLVIPRDDSPHARLDLDRTARGVLLVVAALVALGLLLGSDLLWWLPVPLALALIVGFIIVSIRGDRQPAAPAPTPQHPTPQHPAHQQAAYQQPAPPQPVSPEPGQADRTGQPEQPAWYAAGPVTPPPPAPPAAAPAPRRPRRTGPLLIVPTLALIALGLGILALLDVNGLGVAPGAYPALAVAITGAMLLVGTWVGRPGGLIALGLVGTLALGGAVTGQVLQEVYDAERLTVVPTSATEVQGRYAITNGELTLDLSRVEELGALDGRRIELEMRAGDLAVRVPRGIDLSIDAELDLAGEVRVFGERRDGWRPRLRTTVEDGGEGGSDAEPDITLILRGNAGRIWVDRPAAFGSPVDTSRDTRRSTSTGTVRLEREGATR